MKTKNLMLVLLFVASILTILMIGFYNKKSSSVDLDVFEPDIGYDFSIIDQSYANKPIENSVIEFFSFACPHCENFEPHIQEWIKTKSKNTKFTRIPVVFGRKSWKDLARLYYTTVEMKIENETTPLIFESIHHKVMVDPVNEVIDFIKTKGGSEKDFYSVYRSKRISLQVNEATKLVSQYNIKSVPQLIIGNKYRTNSIMAGSYKNMTKIADFILKKEPDDQSL